TQVLTIIDENNYYPFGLKHKGYNDYVATSNKYKYNGKELQDELGLNMYDYGARNYDPAIGRWMNVDLMAEKAVSITPYRYAFNNPLTFVDPNGNYEVDGHYWTVYLAALLAGKSNAGELAYYAQIPDEIMDRGGDIVKATNTWTLLDWQVDVHALTGGYRDGERRNSELGYFNGKTARQQGYALHRFGDSFAHSKDNGRMYSTGIGHLFEGHTPDKIAERPELYKEYASSLTSMLGGNLEDMFTFNYVADNKGTTEQNSAILETEVRIQEGVKTFSVVGNQVGTINSYMKSRDAYTNTKSKYMATSATGDVYRPDGNGGFTKTTETRTYVIFN
uniref:RHS repeat-associated core domain-containing protein n=1 Tax=Flavobacterium sp. UGB4466 TaxID=2730889 RepID=UPI00192C4C46